MKKYSLYFILTCVCMSAFLTSCDKERYEDNAYFQTVSLDNTFGQNGRTIIPETSEIGLLDFDRHGNIVAAGYTLIGNGKTHLTITKINTDGLLDESFGNNGLVKITDYHSSIPCGLKITRDNKIVVIGDFSKVQFQGHETIMMRFNENGTVDEDFGNNGKVNFNFNTGYLTALNFEDDDFMLIAKQEGEIIDENGVLYYNLTGYSISKYSYTGELDNSFGENGIVYLTNNKDCSISPSCMKILSNGSMIVSGTIPVQTF